MTIHQPGSSTIRFVKFWTKTAFFKLKDIYPECFLYRKETPQVEPMLCVQNDGCPVNKNCMHTVAKRLHALFEEVLPDVEMIILYYKKRNIMGIGGTVFWRDFIEPRNITINPYSWVNVKTRGIVYEFSPGPTFYLTGRAAPPEVAEEPLSSSLD